MFSLIKRQNVLSAAVALFAVAFLALPQLAQAATTGTLYPNGQGTYTAWVGDESDIDETGTPDCEDGNADGNDNIMGDNGPDRESVLINLSGIPDGSTITSVDINVYYRDASGGGSDGTFQTFARLDGSDYDSGANIAASSSTCAGTTQTVDIPDTVKSGSTVLEIGALKTDDDTSNVWVGTLRADITYSPVQWTVTSTAGAGGTITPSATVDGGTSPVFTSTPTSGYVLSDVLVDAGSVGRQNSYTFSNISANHTIDASFEGGFYSPSSYSDGDSDVGTPANASASDDSYAVVNDQNDEIDFGGFGGLGVPLNAFSIDGIELALEGNRPSGSRTIDFSLSWDGGVTWTSPTKNLGSGMGTGDSTVIAGGASDTWGRSWTPAEFDNGNFMVRLDAITSGAGHTLNIDQLSVKVFYTGDVTPPNLAVVTPIGTTESHQPDFTFSTDEDGTLAVGGGCTSTATSATVGNNTIPFGFLASGTYSACTITVTDAYGNSAVLAVPEFTISNAAPASGGGGGGGGNGLFTLVNNNSDVGTQPGSVLGAFTTADEQNQQSQEQQGAVLGASTNVLAASCGADKHLLTSNLGMGKTNPADQVKLLQQFLNQELGVNLPVSGVFGDMTLASVKAFQAAHTADVLAPWGITDPTGYVGVTTRRMIDILVCGADYAIPQLPN